MEQVELIENFLMPQSLIPSDGKITRPIERYVEQFRNVAQNFDITPSGNGQFFLYFHLASILTMSTSWLFKKFPTNKVSL